MDLTSLADPAVYDEFEKEMLKQNIAILFNNAGIAEEKRAFWNYANSTSAGISRVISINSEVVALMTKLVLPGLFISNIVIKFVVEGCLNAKKALSCIWAQQPDYLLLTLIRFMLVQRLLS